ncbi:uncharacterized protein BDZ83DRAFT_193298 [Colletotrichum acutatum]|uniref:Uncharacterized protein n=1 Tax=Glomerella acutata TaxID=27357 RepID=A0AAD8U9L7_GLOAC|nr:uncharacterized protein BDZ83DRAFT_193298 [Colletotrichum acutatum]KAK1706132.1 hypothetical protein BDZ83DRAFT_193298 [Colletotrichum acutatum]
MSEVFPASKPLGDATTGLVSTEATTALQASTKAMQRLTWWRAVGVCFFLLLLTLFLLLLSQTETAETDGRGLRWIPRRPSSLRCCY